ARDHGQGVAESAGGAGASRVAGRGSLQGAGAGPRNFRWRARMNVSQLVAIDTHVHIEHTDEGGPADKAAERYFGPTGAPRERKALAEYYRSRRIGCVVFPVDEKLTGRPMVSNDVVAE